MLIVVCKKLTAFYFVDNLSSVVDVVWAKSGVRVPVLYDRRQQREHIRRSSNQAGIGLAAVGMAVASRRAAVAVWIIAVGHVINAPLNFLAAELATSPLTVSLAGWIKAGRVIALRACLFRDAAAVRPAASDGYARTLLGAVDAHAGDVAPWSAHPAEGSALGLVWSVSFAHCFRP
jgi:hypothetical protein